MTRVPPTMNYSFTEENMTFTERRNEYRKAHGLAVEPWCPERAERRRQRLSEPTIINLYDELPEHEDAA